MRDVLSALEAIDPAQLTYEEWLAVGQALHHEGYDVSAWRDWSRSDAARFKEREFDAKWKSFGHETGEPVTGGTIFKLARDAGWRLDAPAEAYTALSWDSFIGADVKPIADGTMKAGNVLKPLDGMGACKQAASYIRALFADDENVSFVVKAAKDEHGKYRPVSAGVCYKTAAQIANELDKGRFDNAFGTPDEDAGMWVCINPVDGKGRNNDNVTALRHCLIESDETDPAACKSVYEQLRLPIAAMVYSGRNSLHAIVRLDARDMDEYNARREAVYKACEDSGVVVDRANKNPARLSRMAGAMRGEQQQFLVSLECGCGDFEEWLEWYERANDDLPACESLADVLKKELPPLADEVIAGVLRKRHKMLLSGASKSGKSWLLIQLCIALAEGREWLGFKCRQSKVLYVNLELDHNSLWHRFSDVYAKLGLSGEFAENLHVWNLRGLAQPMHKLLPKMVRRGKENGYEVIVIDPIYKIMTGDENSASDMAAFANAFDRLAYEVGCSVIYCHHHSKGWQDGKKSIDRASGSGVFGRDPDAILDLIELEPKSGASSKIIGEKVTSFIDGWMAEHDLMPAWTEETTPADRRTSGDAQVAADTFIKAHRPELYDGYRKNLVKVKDTKLTAWKCEGTLREFEAFEPVCMWFDWPLHRLDDTLRTSPEKGTAVQVKAAKSSESKTERAHRIDNEAIEAAVDFCTRSGLDATRKNVLDNILKCSTGKKPTEKQLARWTENTASDANDWCEWVCITDVNGKAGIIQRKSEVGK